MFAQGNVKSTYSELTVQPNGALLASADPMHVTARAMNALQSSGLAHYTGGARLWQGSNIVEAQTIDFDQKARTIVALGDRKRPVTSVFLQVDEQGQGFDDAGDGAQAELCRQRTAGASIPAE